MSEDALNMRMKRAAEKAKREAKNSSRLIADHKIKEGKEIAAQVRSSFYHISLNNTSACNIAKYALSHSRHCIIYLLFYVETS